MAENDATYLLPHDAAEHVRLDRQSRAIYTAMGNRHVHAPIPKDASLIIDSGCGTGAVSVALALDNPGAKVVGVDLAAPPSDLIPPPNLTFIQGDTIHLAGKDERLSRDTADLVYSRFLLLGLKGGRWPEYVRTLASLLKPGAYLNMVDLALRVYRCTDINNLLASKQNVASKWADYTSVAAAEQGFDLLAGLNLESYMKDAGLEDVQVREYVWPCGSWLGEIDPSVKEVGKLNDGKSLSPAIRMFLSGRYSEEEIVEIQQDLEAGWEHRPGYFMVLYAVTGRKPAK